jgi:ribose transport system ATP-binding protein
MLHVSDLHKTFGDARVLSGVTLRVGVGEVHALLGENGAGKSTLVRILAGALAADRGDLQLAGQQYCPDSPSAAWAAGLGTIHQELSLIPALSVADNIMLGRECTRRGLVDQARRDRSAREALDLLGQHGVDLSTLVQDLAPAQRQLVEIARALARDARLLVMDEPTSSLDGEDVERLLSVVRQLRERGISFLYISHHLAEVRAVCDRVTVLRDGCAVATGPLAEFRDDDLVRHMAGREIGELFPSRAASPGDVVMRIDGLDGVESPGGTVVRSVGFELRAGEICGVGGLCGAGRSELLETLFGLRMHRRGRVEVRAAALVGDVSSRWQRKLGLLAEDRRGKGLSLRQSVAENIVLPSAKGLCHRGWLSPDRVEQAAVRWIDQLGIRCQGPRQPVSELSGGNQQKVALARILQAGCDVLLLDEPTRGIDVQSRQQIYSLLARTAQAGSSVLMVSSHLPELLGLCDRIGVMHEGRLGTMRPIVDWTQEELLSAALGRSEQVA